MSYYSSYRRSAALANVRPSSAYRGTASQITYVQKQVDKFGGKTETAESTTNSPGGRNVAVRNVAAQDKIVDTRSSHAQQFSEHDRRAAAIYPDTSRTSQYSSRSMLSGYSTNNGVDPDHGTGLHAHDTSAVTGMREHDTSARTAMREHDTRARTAMREHDTSGESDFSNRLIKTAWQDHNTSAESGVNDDRRPRAGKESDLDRQQNETTFQNSTISLPPETLKFFEAIKVISTLGERSKGELEELMQQQAKNSSVNFRKKIQELETEIKSLREENKKNADAIKDAVASKESALLQVKGHEDLQQLLQRRELEVKQLTENIQTKEVEVTRKQGYLDKLLQEKEQLSTELSSCKSRLSKLMGDKLADNNPNIADLSDRNRPTKLAEKFTDLYDNEWTDAFEISEELFTEERKRIEVLRAVLEDVRTFCDELAKEQTKTLMEWLTMKSATRNELPKDLPKQIKDLKKAHAELSLDGVYQQYIQYVQRLSEAKGEVAKLVLDRRAQPFVEKCVHLCWLMCVQDPPVVLGSDLEPGHLVNPNYHKFYTKSGEYIEYIVWPSLLLHEGGALLCKGVVQGGPAMFVQTQNQYATATARERRRRHLPGTEEVKAQSIKAKASNNQSSYSLRSAIYQQNEHLPSHYASVGYTRTSENEKINAVESKMKDSNTNATESKMKDSNTNATESKMKETNRNATESKMKETNSAHNAKPNTESSGTEEETPTREEWARFLELVKIYGVDSPYLKSCLGVRYQVCRNYAKRTYNV